MTSRHPLHSLRGTVRSLLLILPAIIKLSDIDADNPVVSSPKPVGLLIAGRLIVETRVAGRLALEVVEEVEDDLSQRQLVAKLNAFG